MSDFRRPGSFRWVSVLAEWAISQVGRFSLGGRSSIDEAQRKADADDLVNAVAVESQRSDCAATSVEQKVFANGRVRRDRRKALRYEVDDSAAILLVRVGSTLRGRILDLSSGGCRIRTNDRFSVGIYTFVEIEFIHEGMPFRLAGVIQAVHDRTIVGIRFLDVSERKGRQLEELIQDLAELPAQQTLKS